MESESGLVSFRPEASAVALERNWEKDRLSESDSESELEAESELVSRSASLQAATLQLQIGDRSRLRLPFLVKCRLRLRHGSPKRIGCRKQSRTSSSSRSLSRHQDVPRRQVPSFGCGIGFGILGGGIGVRSGIEVGVEIDVGISVGVSTVRFWTKLRRRFRNRLVRL